MAFKFRIPHDIQAPKMADVLPNENVWSKVKDMVMERRSPAIDLRVV